MSTQIWRAWIFQYSIHHSVANEWASSRHESGSSLRRIHFDEPIFTNQVSKVFIYLLILVTTTSKASQFTYWMIKDMRLSHSHPWWPRHVKVGARNPKKNSITTLWEEHNLLFLDLPNPLVSLSSFLSYHVQVWFRIPGSCITVFQTWSLCRFLNSTPDPNWLDSLSWVLIF